MRCAVYIRVSTNKEEQKSSLKNQQDMFYRYIGEKGWDIYKIYVDIESGTTDKRSNLQELIKDAKSRKFDVILAKELSRLARNGGLSYQIRDIAERNHVHIVTLDNAINTLEGNGNMFGLYAWMYEQESQRTSDRVKASFRTRASKGLFKGSIPPFGYEVIEGRLYVRNDDTPSIVRRIFREYLQGSGTDSIARRLYKDGYPTPSMVAGKNVTTDKWHGSTIKKILTNPHYVGDLVQCRDSTRSVTSKAREPVAKNKLVIVENTHEAIISKDDFEAVQEQMRLRTKNITAPQKHLFTNIAFCAECGTGMWYRQNRKGYICGGYGRHGKKACSPHSIKEAFLKQVILEDLKQMSKSLNEQDLMKRLENKATKIQQQSKKQINAIDKDIEQLKEEKKRLIKLLANEVISQEDYKEVNEANNQKLQELNLKKEELEAAVLTKNEFQEIDLLRRELDRFMEFNNLTTEVLHRLVSRIEIKADGSPRIFYRFSVQSAII